MTQEGLLYSRAKSGMHSGNAFLQKLRGEAQSLKKCLEINWRDNDVMLLLKIIFNIR